MLLEPPGDLANKKEELYLSAVINGWIETRMERDRTLLALSTGGVGLLVTLVTTVGPPGSFIL